MQAVCQQLTAAEVEIVPCVLQGHGDNFAPVAGQAKTEARLRSFSLVKEAVWCAEVQTAYAMAAQQSQEHSVPLFLVAYSLGALLGCDLLVTTPDAHFAGMALFAPALRIHRHWHLLQLLFLWPRLLIPSLSPAHVRANRATPIAAYRALFTANRRFNRTLNTHGGERLNVPTLLFLDEQDELVSYSGIKQLINQAQLTPWQLYPVNKSNVASRRHYHHLILDAETVGQETWSAMMTQLVHFVQDNCYTPYGQVL